jgi:DNA-binding transcriptional LysR family regulator
MELRHLRYAVAVADVLSFTRAAERLHIAQPPLTQQIRALEAELGLELFHRTKRRVELTPSGRVFVQHARRILASVEEMTAASQRVHRGEVGRIAIGFLSSIAFDYFPRVIRAFRSRFPDVEVELRELKQLPMLEALRTQTLDVAFIRNFIDDPEIDSRTVLREHFLAALPAGHRLAGRSSVAPADLRDEPFVTVMRRDPPSLYAHTVGICERAGFHPRVVQEANDVQSCVGLVSAGVGVSIVPDTIRVLAVPGITYSRLRGIKDEIEIVVAWRKDDTNRVIGRFVEVVLESSAARRTGA